MFIWALCTNYFAIRQIMSCHFCFPTFVESSLSLSFIHERYPNYVRNCHPTSLLCILWKILELIIYYFFHASSYSWAPAWFSAKTFLSYQSTGHSFRDKQSPKWQEFLGWYLLGLQKSFDSVPHNELLYELWSVGITGTLFWFWFNIYLTNRYHFVQVEDCSSECFPVISGTPQGSILGPLLFLIYINDITSRLPLLSMYIFVDDRKILNKLTSKGVNKLSEGSLN